MFSGSGFIYHALLLSDFFTLATFATSHPGLDPDGDDNRDGESNFLDYAAGNDPALPELAAPFELDGGQLTYRVRTDAADVYAGLKVSTDLVNWAAMEEGIHYTLASDTEADGVRTVVWNLIPVAGRAFYRLDVGTSPEP